MDRPEPTADDDARSPTSPLQGPRASQVVMLATYACGMAGYFFGFLRLSSGGATAAIVPVALLSVGVTGVLSMIRHSLLHRSDAARMGWDYGRRNNFQIEVGFANLAIGAVAIAAVVLDWGVRAEGAITLAYALYFVQVVVLSLIDRTDGRLDVGRLAAMVSQAVLLGFFSIAALAAA